MGMGMNSMMQEMMSNPEMVRSMMDSPMMQQMLDNPEMMRQVMQSNPQFRQMQEANPQMAEMLLQPSALREAMNMMANPALQQEAMRQMDRAYTNVESMPGGTEALRNMVNQVQGEEPETAGGMDEPSPAANPWMAGSWATPAQPTQPTQGQTPQAPTQPAPGTSAPAPQMFGLGGTPATNPAFAHPEVVEALRQLQENFATLSRHGVLNEIINMGMGAGGMPQSTPMAPQHFPAMPTPQAPIGNPREMFADQLQQLRDMGFTNDQQNLNLLSQCGGNVEIVVSHLLGN